MEKTEILLLLYLVFFCFTQFGVMVGTKNSLMMNELFGVVTMTDMYCENWCLWWTDAKWEPRTKPHTAMTKAKCSLNTKHECDEKKSNKIKETGERRLRCCSKTGKFAVRIFDIFVNAPSSRAGSIHSSYMCMEMRMDFVLYRVVCIRPLVCYCCCCWCCRCCPTFSIQALIQITCAPAIKTHVHSFWIGLPLDPLWNENVCFSVSVCVCWRCSMIVCHFECHIEK